MSKRRATQKEILEEGRIQYMNGDTRKAFSTMLKLAQRNNREAQFICGFMYKRGNGTRKNLNKALYWFQRAAEQDHIDAQFACGFMYQYGEGTDIDRKASLYWFGRAAEQGNVDAMLVIRNAAEQGSEQAKDVLHMCRQC